MFVELCLLVYVLLRCCVACFDVFDFCLLDAYDCLLFLLLVICVVGLWCLPFV